MSISPHITFKAGKCEFDPENKKVQPVPTPGFIYLYTNPDDELLHFCWRERTAPLSQPDIDLVMVPSDGTFKPYSKPSAATQKPHSPTTGRVCILKFGSSEDRHFFWLQSREQPAGPEHQNVFSERDLRLIKIVDGLLQGEEVQTAEVREVRNMGRGGGRGGGGSGFDGDTTMEDIARTESTGGAGPDATGGDVREEGEESREGGADGGRANLSSTTTNQPDLNTLLASISAGPRSSQHPQAQQISTTLQDLLPTATTVPALAALPLPAVDRLLREHLPPEILTLSSAASASASAPSVDDALARLSEPEKRRILEKVLRSAQFAQALASITGALRDGGLTSVSEALGVQLDGAGALPGTGQVVNGGAAVEVFLEALRREAERETRGDDEDEGRR